MRALRLGYHEFCLLYDYLFTCHKNKLFFHEVSQATFGDLLFLLRFLLLLLLLFIIIIILFLSFRGL
jgi:hypothetical protein